MEFEDIQSLCGAKRRSFTQTQRAAHVAEWQRSGMSAADYAHTHQLGLSSLYRWRHLYAESVSQASPFVPVRIKVDQSSSDCRLRVTLKTPQLECIIEGAGDGRSFAELAGALRREVIDV